MKIGLDMRMADPEYGIGRYSLEIAKALLETDKLNTYVLFVRDPMKFRKAGFEQFPNVRLVQTDYRHYSFAEQILFLFALWKQKVDLMHFLNFNVPLFYKGAFVVTIHDVVHLKLPGNKKRRFIHRWAMKKVLLSAAQNSKRIITVSHFSKKEIIESLQVPAYKIDVIYEAANPVAVSDSEIVAVRQKFAITKPYIIFIGVLERKKNLIALAQGFNLLKEKFQVNIQLVIAGKADEHYPEVSDAIKKVTYGKDIILTGIISEKEKYALLSGSKAFVSASLFEGFGLPGVEAMSVGTPLVVSNSEVFNEIYDNGAIYFDPFDPSDIAQKINFLLADDKYRSQVADHAYVRAQAFSWKKTAQLTLETYEKSTRQTK